MDKPWEKNGEEFDAEKAWTLIQNLRSEKSELQSKLQTVADERDSAFGEREKVSTEVEQLKANLQLMEDDLSAKDKDISKIQTLRTKENALIERGLPRHLAQYIPDGDEEQITSAIEDFTSIRGHQVGEVLPPNPAQVADESTSADGDKEAAAKKFFGIE